MPTPRHLSNAPITEAIIDFRVKAKRDFKAERFKEVREVLRDRFPIAEEALATKVTFEIRGGKTKSPDVESFGLMGYQLKATDGKMIAQFRVDGFTLNRLKPYSSWEELWPIAKELWSLFSGTAEPEAVTRIALRYINHISLPPEMDDFDRYLRASPPVPAELPQGVSEFFVRTTLHDQASQRAAHVVQAIQADVDARKLLYVLDIDAFLNGIWSPTDKDLELRFEELRNFKNDIFFSYVTDETLRQFE